MVRSPVTSKVVSPTWRISVETKAICGYCSSARKSLVQVLVALGVAGVDAGGVDGHADAGDGGLAPSMTAVPSNSLNEPRTFVTIACRATKPMRVWVGSRV